MPTSLGGCSVAAGACTSVRFPSNHHYVCYVCGDFPQTMVDATVAHSAMGCFGAELKHPLERRAMPCSKLCNIVWIRSLSAMVIRVRMQSRGALSELNIAVALGRNTIN